MSNKYKPNATETKQNKCKKFISSKLPNCPKEPTAGLYYKKFVCSLAHEFIKKIFQVNKLIP